MKEKLRQWKMDNPIRKFRKDKGYSQPDVAAILDVAVYSVQRWEDGSVNPSGENLVKLNKLINEFEGQWNEWKNNKPKL